MKRFQNTKTENKMQFIKYKDEQPTEDGIYACCDAYGSTALCYWEIFGEPCRDKRRIQNGNWIVVIEGSINIEEMGFDTGKVLEWAYCSFPQKKKGKEPWLG